MRGQLAPAAAERLDAPRDTVATAAGRRKVRTDAISEPQSVSRRSPSTARAARARRTQPRLRHPQRRRGSGHDAVLSSADDLSFPPAFPPRRKPSDHGALRPVCAGLENRYGRKSIGGSNPPLSVTNCGESADMRAVSPTTGPPERGSGTPLSAGQDRSGRGLISPRFPHTRDLGRWRCELAHAIQQDRRRGGRQLPLRIRETGGPICRA